MLVIKGKNGKSKWVSENILYKEYGHLIISKDGLEINPDDHTEFTVYDNFTAKDIKRGLESINMKYSLIFLNLNAEESDINDYVSMIKKFNIEFNSKIKFIISVYGDNDELDIWEVSLD